MNENNHSTEKVLQPNDCTEGEATKHSIENVLSYIEFMIPDMEDMSEKFTNILHQLVLITTDVNDIVDDNAKILKILQHVNRREEEEVQKPSQKIRLRELQDRIQRLRTHKKLIKQLQDNISQM